MTVDWLIQGTELDPVAGAERAWVLKRDDTTCPFRIETNANDALSAAIVESPATHKKKVLGWRQLRLTANTDRLVVASAYDLYGNQVDVTLDTSDPATVVATITHGEATDRWEWVPSQDPRETYALSGTRDGEQIAGYGPDDRPHVE